MSLTLFQNPVVSLWTGAAIFADIIKNLTMSIKTAFKVSRKVRRIRNYVLKCNL